ncbi:peroxinectin [Cavenderia fasciculata]|uniref:Peroxinectin n=1 Tax=Cavenderia fasciculata TaxID=261658 RepID=F4PJN3_CACFS|nr:peroxinectin [Cavenderia fasciculata]EGG23807.1 peroxinectin [Cavenderia fasciculata]|eukprot:XP_004361658.1 peroxinectin [Cavenderia fasciculata]
MNGTSQKLTLLSVFCILCLLYPFTNGESTEWRSYDGSNNNLINPNQGEIYEPFIRVAQQQFFNPDDYPTLSIPLSREVSNIVCDQQSPVPSKELLSDMFNMWGQFLIHNMAHALPTPTNGKYPVKVPQCDKVFDPSCEGNKTLPYFRTRVTEVDCSTPFSTRQENNLCMEQVNSLSAYIDAKPVYGVFKARVNLLRAFKNGEMKLTDLGEKGEFPPKGIAGLEMDNDARRYPIDQLFSLGERRGNENPGLTVVHNIWLREHNRMARKIVRDNPSFEDEKVFQMARSCVIENIQQITYEEYLPSLLGESLPPYSGYDDEVNAQISNEFTTVAFRFGHSEVGPTIESVNADGTYNQPLPLKDSYFNPKWLEEQGMENVIRGLSYKQEESVDIYMISDLRNFLFGRPGAGGMDLASRNLQRSRDHGIATYNTVRKSLGFQPVNSFSDITSDPVIQQRLEAAYKTVDNVELFTGGLSEDHIGNGAVGQTFHRLITEQFERTRKGDRFWYEQPWMKRVNAHCEPDTFANIIRRNTKDMGQLQKNIFHIPNVPSPVCELSTSTPSPSSFHFRRSIQTADSYIYFQQSSLANNNIIPLLNQSNNQLIPIPIPIPIPNFSVY